jgi:benzoyl-CoA 2,3-dioxygenase component B
VIQRGGIPLDNIQRHLNLWFSVSEDLFGGEISSNAADFFAAGLKGRYKEASHEDHIALSGYYEMPTPEAGGKLSIQQVPLRNAMNEVLRDQYVADCQRAVDKWNRTLERVLGAGAAVDKLKLRLPHRRFHRQIGIYSMPAGHAFDMDGNPIGREDWDKNRDRWLPTAEDRAYVLSLMRPVSEPGQIAGWIAPPARGINSQPFDFQYVRHVA